MPRHRLWRVYHIPENFDTVEGCQTPWNALCFGSTERITTKSTIIWYTSGADQPCLNTVRDDV